MLIVDLEDRQTRRIAQAWQLITQYAPGNSGKIQALEYLNSADCHSPRYPTKWELWKSCGVMALFVSPQQAESLNGIDLSEKTHSSSVYLLDVDLSGADHVGANLSGVNLDRALFEGETQFDSACGDKKTRLPEGLTINIKACPKKSPWSPIP